MKAVGRYDTALQMFVEETREPDLRRLSFLRWLVESGRLEHRPFGASSGEFVSTAEGTQQSGAEMPLGNAMRRNGLGITKFTADLGGLGKDGVQLGAPPEGGQSFRFRR